MGNTQFLLAQSLLFSYCFVCGFAFYNYANYGSPYGRMPHISSVSGYDPNLQQTLQALVQQVWSSQNELPPSYAYNNDPYKEEAPPSYAYGNDPYSLARAYGIRDDQMDMNQRGATHFELHG